MIKAFQHEIQDNLVDALAANTIALSIYPSSIARQELSIADILPPTQFTDLFYFEDILVSSGWNGNDDVFGVEELWKARATPMLKKIDYMHDESDIIGVMCKVKAMSFDGLDVDFDATADLLPKSLDIHVGGYLYKMWKDEKLQARMDDILANINDWCVSMECSFPHFDYAVEKPNGEQFIIQRNDQTSFLTKHLRIYRGSGEYEGYKIGRYLKDFIFTGKGLVKNPANKRSIITKTEFIGAAASLNIFPNVEKSMEITKEMLESLQKQVTELTLSVANLTASESNLKSENAKLDVKVVSLTEANQAFKTQNEKLESELTTSKASLTQANDQLAVFNSEKVKATRLALFADVDVDAAKAEELVTKFIGVSDEMFNSVVAAMPKKKVEAKCEDDKKEKKEGMAALDSAVPETTVASVPVQIDTTKKTRETTVAWLKTNMNSKKGE